MSVWTIKIPLRLFMGALCSSFFLFRRVAQLLLDDYPFAWGMIDIVEMTMLSCVFSASCVGRGLRPLSKSVGL